MHPCFTFLLFLILTSVCTGQTSGRFDPSSQKSMAAPGVIDEILVSSGLKRDLRFIRGRLESEVTLKQQRSPEEERRLEQRALEAFHPDSLYKSAFRFCQSRFDSARAALVLFWLRTPLARKLKEIEDTSFVPSAEKGIVRYSKQLKSNPPPERRIVLVKRLEDAEQGSNRMADLLSVLLTSAVKSANASAPPDKKLSEKGMELFVNQLKRQMTPKIRAGLWLTYLYAYRPLTDDELLSYIQFLESDLGVWYLNSLHGAMKLAVTVASEKMVQASPEIVKEIQ